MTNPPPQPDPNWQPPPTTGMPQQPPQGQPSYPAPGQDPAGQPGYGPPPGQPGYGQQPPTGGFGQPQQQQNLQQKLQGMPPKKLAMFGGIGGGALLVVIILIIAISSGGGPSSTVDDYLGAVADLDIEESVSYLCDVDDDLFDADDLADPAVMAEAEELVADLDWEIVNEHVAGDEATVTVKVTSSSEDMSGTWDVELEKRDGDWFICEM